MTNWEAGHTQAITNFMYSQTIMFIAGLYVYEYMCTFWFDWCLVTRKIMFKWPYVPYLVGRYLILLVLCGLIAINNITHPLNCEVVMPSLITAGLIAGACATCNLMIRTVVMWGHRREIVFVLILLSLGQVAFSVYAGTSLVKSHFCTTLRTCNVDYSGHTIFSSVFVYTVSYEFLVLVLTWIRVSKSSLMATLRSQGLWYFLLAFMVNLPAAIFPWLDLNDTMNMMFYTPATTLSVIISCRAVSSLIKANIDTGHLQREAILMPISQADQQKYTRPHVSNLNPYFSSNIA